jgi:DNA mismatch endonuclease (patch repair protein)
MPKSNKGYWSPKLLKNQKRDAKHLRTLRKAGWTVLVVWECELRNPSRTKARIARFLG